MTATLQPSVGTGTADVAVRFMDVDSTVRWIQAVGAERIIAEMIDVIEDDFRRWESFDKTSRVASHSPEGVIELMPTSDGQTYSFKYVNGHPSNPARGFQTVTAFGSLAHVHNGYPSFISEMTLITALRTAATSAMVGRLLARPDSSTMSMIGTGSQAEFQALGFRAAMGINRLRIWDVDPDAMTKLVRNLGPLGFEIYVAGSASDAVAGSDIVTTCTADKTNATVLSDEMVADGIHINAIGGDCPGKTELEATVLERGPVFVEYAEQTRVEGEIQQMPPDFPVTEIWHVLTGARGGRTNEAQVTIFDSVGFAIEDFSALRYVLQSVDRTGHGTTVQLIVDPDDPKDLFALVGAPR
jgi:ornithine cyclodeaminase